MYSTYFRQNVVLILIFALMFSLFSNAVYALDANLNPNANESVKMNADNEFPDVQASFAKQEIQALVKKGILSGFEDGTFKPNDSITRGQLAKILVLSLGMKEDPDAAARFQDVASNSWYRGFVGALVKTGITDGTSSETFSPDDRVSREQLAVFFIRAFGLEEKAKQLQPDAPLTDRQGISDWAKADVSFAFKIGFLQGMQNVDGTLQFGPKQFAERQALARLAYEFTAHSQTYLDEANKLMSGKDPKELLKAAIQAANEAIAALPAGSITKDNGTDVQAARDKVDAAKKLGATDNSFPDLNKLANAEKTIADLSQVMFGGGGGGGGRSSGTPHSIGVTEVSTITAGTHNGDFKVSKGVTTFGPVAGTAVINGTLILDPGFDKELVLQNIQATKIEVRSGADHSIRFSGVVQASTLFINVSSQSNTVRIVASSETVIGTTSVASQAILDASQGSLGNVDIQSEAAGDQVELLGSFGGSVSVSGQGTQLVVAQNTTVSQLNVTSGATITSNGTVSQLSMTSAAAGQQLNLIGSFSSTVVSLSADRANVSIGQGTTVSQIQVNSGVSISSSGTVDQLSMTPTASGKNLNLAGAFSSTVVSISAPGANVSVAQNTNVSQMHVSSAATINSSGSINEVSADTAQAISFVGAFATTTINVTVNGSQIIISQSTTVSVIRVAPNITSTSISTEGTITSIESSTSVVIDMSGSKKDDTIENAIKAAKDAITGLPSVNQLTVVHVSRVTAARNKVSAAKALKTTALAEITNLDVLVAAETQIAQLIQVKNDAVQAAIGAINALPADIVYGSKSQVDAARASVNDALAKGAVSSDITNLNKLVQAELTMPQLISAKNISVQAAITAITALPTTLIYSDKSKVESARQLVNSARVKGAMDSEITNLSRLQAAEAVIAELIALPVVKSASATIGGASIPAAIGSNNQITFTLPSTLNDTDMVTGFTINASNNAKELTVTFAGLSRTIAFQNGTVLVTISQLLGTAFDPQGDGVSVGVLRAVLTDGALTVPGTLTDLSGHSLNVALKLVKATGVSAPVFTSAAAKINGQNVAAAISPGNYITFTVSDSLANNAMITGFIIQAGVKAQKLTFGPSVTRSVYFTNGIVDMSVSALLGSAFDPQGDGVSVGALRNVMGHQNLTLTGILVDTDGNSSLVSLTIIVTTDAGAPSILSASAAVYGVEVPATIGANQHLSFVINNMFNDTDMITGFTIHASADTFELTVTSSGISRTIPFQNGTAHMTVAQLLGSSFDPQGNGKSVGVLRQQLNGSDLVVAGQLKDQSGLISNVTVTVMQTF